MTCFTPKASSPHSRWTKVWRSCCVASLFAAAALASGSAQASDVTELPVVGGLAGVSQYTRFEEPFWTNVVPQITDHRVRAEIHPFDRTGFRGQEMLQLMRLGVVPFGTALLSVVAAEEPELNAVDLPALSPDMNALRQNVGLYRSHLQDLLRERYDIELLAIYTYPAQVLYCTQAFTGLEDLAGRRIRTSSVGQSSLVTALGATPIVVPFAEIVRSIKAGLADCAITGTQSGVDIGLPGVTNYIHTMALSWGLSFFGANVGVWDNLPQEVRTSLRDGIAQLETDIWNAADRETAEGLACNTGQTSCPLAKRQRMTAVPMRPSDTEYQRKILTEIVLPDWIKRCGQDCVSAWNQTLGPVLGIDIGSR